MNKNKHSLNINGHKTSVSLEPDFWLYFVEIAKRNEMSANALATKIDANRLAGSSLASQIRSFCLMDAKGNIK